MTPPPTHTHTLTQDIGVQGYSTLHCIRFRGLGIDVKMATPLKKVAESLVNIDRSPSRTGQIYWSLLTTSASLLTVYWAGACLWAMSELALSMGKSEVCAEWQKLLLILQILANTCLSYDSGVNSLMFSYRSLHTKFFKITLQLVLFEGV